MSLLLDLSSFYIFSVLPCVYPAVLSIMELGNSHAMKLYSSWYEKEEAKNPWRRQNLLPSLPSVSLFPLDFGVRWRTDFLLTMSRLWSPFCPQILRGPRRGKES